VREEGKERWGTFYCCWELCCCCCCSQALVKLEHTDRLSAQISHLLHRKLLACDFLSFFSVLFSLFSSTVLSLRIYFCTNVLSSFQLTWKIRLCGFAKPAPPFVTVSLKSDTRKTGKKEPMQFDLCKRERHIQGMIGHFSFFLVEKHFTRNKWRW
jgi:hypothetical protein